jgi:hypothetical protein
MQRHSIEKRRLVSDAAKIAQSVRRAHARANYRDELAEMDVLVGGHMRRIAFQARHALAAQA